MSRSETRTAPVHSEIARLRAALQDQKARAVRGLDAERSAIARELHDSFGQYLTAMEMELGAILRGGAPPPQIEARLAKMRALTAQAQQDMAQMAWQIRPAMLEDMDLARACDQLIAQWSSRSDISFDLHLSLGDRKLPVFVANTLYRVLQEAIANSVKHADASRIGVILQAVSQEAVLIVEDDGDGFSQDAIGPESGPSPSLGLLGIRERLSLVEGSLEIETSPGHGTALLVRVPL
jgi:signal transduction histidine kinase